MLTAATTFAAFMPQLLAGGWGRIVAVSSPVAQQPGPDSAAYAASKAGLDAIVLSAAREGSGRGLTANLLVVRSIRDEPVQGTSAADRQWTRPSELAAAMLWLCSDEAGQTTGARIPSTEAADMKLDPLTIEELLGEGRETIGARATVPMRPVSGSLRSPTCRRVSGTSRWSPSGTTATARSMPHSSAATLRTPKECPCASTLSA